MPDLGGVYATPDYGNWPDGIRQMLNQIIAPA